jgi:hypothetical protein
MRPLTPSPIFFTGLFVLLAVGCGGPARVADPRPNLTAQVEVLQNTERSAVPTPDAFVFLADETPTDSASFVGRIRASVSAPPDAVFEAMRRRAVPLGANAFRVRGAGCGPGARTCTVTLDLFARSKDQLVRNAARIPENRIYVFGSLAADGRPKTFKLNGRKTSVGTRAYVAYQNEVGQKATIAVGGFTGARLTLTGHEGRPSSYWSLSPFGVGPYHDASPMAPRGNIGLSFNTGRIYPIPPDFGHFLVRVLDERSPDDGTATAQGR